jgi:hypothetical protein
LVIPGGPKCYLYFYVGGNIDISDYTVHFKYAVDDVLVSDTYYPEYITHNTTEKVRPGRFVTIPSPRSIPNCRFDSWYQYYPVSSDALSINSLVKIDKDNTEFVARFYRMFTLTFQYAWNNATTLITKYTVINGKCYDINNIEMEHIVFPAAPDMEGYTYSWDTSNLPSGWPNIDSINSDLVITANYTPISDEFAIVNDEDVFYNVISDNELEYVGYETIMYLDVGIDDNGQLEVLDISDNNNEYIANILSPYMVE